ncbi:MAG: hypothetical protein AAF236_17755, partial [Verrucomicrobiota bacterium]
MSLRSLEVPKLIGMIALNRPPSDSELLSEKSSLRPHDFQLHRIHSIYFPHKNQFGIVVALRYPFAK